MDAKEFNRISQIVSERGWDAYDDVRPDGKTMLDVLVEFMSPLGLSELGLVVELLEDYLMIREYHREIVGILSEIVKRADGKPIIISAVKDDSATKVKSGAALTFEFNSNIHFFEDQAFTFSEDPSSDRFQNFDGFKVLVDDFIGTGGQFLKMCNKLKEKGYSAKVDLVASIVIQQQGKQSLERAGFQVFSPHERPKSIQRLIDLSGRASDEIYATYDSLEARMGCAVDYQRGYGKSEATVSLKKTPNNTLPIFWYQGKKKWPAPFPRPRS